MKKAKHKIPVHECEGIRIREIRPGYFMVDVMRDGKRERTGFRTLPLAEDYCRQLSAKIRTDGTSILTMSAPERSDAAEALREAKGKTSLVEAVRFWMRHNGGEDGVSLDELGRRWLANLKAQGCRKTTLAERSQKVARLADDWGDRTAASITRDELVQWLQSKGLTGATWDGYRRAYRAMMQYAVEDGILEYNPAAGLRPMRLDEKLPTPFTPEATASIMEAARKYAPIMAPTLAVQFFGGLRPGEALGLDWSAVDFKQRIIRVMPETSKVRRSRIIEMNKTLIDWLLPYRRPSGPIGIHSKAQFSFYMGIKRMGRKVKGEKGKTDSRPKGIVRAAGVKWIQDGPRKTYATMHFATYGDAARLAGILGHTGGNDVLYRHYRGLATKADAKRYWKIRPASAGNVKRANFKRASA